MTTVYSNSTAIPHGTGDPNTDLDDSKRSFDVYEAYQRALADEEVSLVPCPSIVDGSVFSSKHPDIPPSCGNTFSHGTCHTF
jgi:hypothetical protein